MIDRLFLIGMNDVLDLVGAALSAVAEAITASPAHRELLGQ